MATYEQFQEALETARKAEAERVAKEKKGTAFEEEEEA